MELVPLTPDERRTSKDPTVQAVLDAVRDAVLLVDGEGRVTAANRQAEQLFQMRANGLAGTDCFALMADRRSLGLIDYLRQTLLPKDPARPDGAPIELVGRQPHGVLVPIEVTSGRIEQPGPSAFVLTIRDIAAAKVRERELREGATRDRLTMVATRAHIELLADAELFRVSRYERPLSVLLFDIDHFKRVNDTYGHGAGDRVLREIARRCRTLIRGSDLIGRWGGEEFVVMTPETPIGGAETLAERLREAIAEAPVTLDSGESIPVTVSVGVAGYQPGDAELEAMVRRADAALYRAKAKGRNRVEIEDALALPLKPAA
jgi:diguanylate cyclase (GGDEF)-like protein/PAS domain S-box-containing protein